MAKVWVSFNSSCKSKDCAYIFGRIHNFRLPEFDDGCHRKYNGGSIPWKECYISKGFYLYRIPKHPGYKISKVEFDKGFWHKRKEATIETGYMISPTYKWYDYKELEWNEIKLQIYQKNLDLIKKNEKGYSPRKL